VSEGQIEKFSEVRGNHSKWLIQPIERGDMSEKRMSFNERDGWGPYINVNHGGRMSMWQQLTDTSGLFIRIFCLQRGKPWGNEVAIIAPAGNDFIQRINVYCILMAFQLKL